MLLVALAVILTEMRVPSCWPVPSLSVILPADTAIVVIIAAIIIVILLLLITQLVTQLVALHESSTSSQLVLSLKAY